MTKMMIRVLAAAIALTGSQTLLMAQGTHSIEGTWDINVHVVDCQSGALIRNIRSLQAFREDGSVSDTGSTFLRGSGLGSWAHTGGNDYVAEFYFFRYNPDGTFKSLAEGLNKYELSGDGSHFTATGTVTDYDATGNVLSVGCVTQAARRLASLDN